mmetsp:Transcript_114899/g.228689  ORF Transcript_114899/g.228689 Transcript_114899/m.228689 type:complete len:559 (+) Transcript_114899:118-1794(+)
MQMMAAALPLRQRTRLQPPAELIFNEEHLQPFFADQKARTQSKGWVLNLAHCRCFEGRSPEFVQQLVTRLCPRYFFKGQEIVKEGSSAYQTFFMISGCAEIVVGSDLRSVMELPEGSIFGDMAIYGADVSLATVRALERCECRVIDYRRLRSLLKSYPAEEQFFRSLGTERKRNLEMPQQPAKARRSFQTRSSLGASSIAAQTTVSTSKEKTQSAKTQALLTHNETLLGNADFFSGCRPEFLKRLAPYLELTTFEAGDNIICEGDEGYLMYLLKSGAVEVLSGIGADEKLLAIFEAGHFFGEMALFGMPVRSATVRASELCECCVVNFHDFQKVLRHFPDERVYFSNLAMERQKSNASFNVVPSRDRDAYSSRLHELRSRSAMVPTTTAAGGKTPVSFHLSNMGQSVFRTKGAEQVEDPSPAGGFNGSLTPQAHAPSGFALFEVQNTPRTFMLNKRVKADKFCLDGRPCRGGSIRSARSRESTKHQASAAQRPASAGSVAMPYMDDCQDFMTESKTLSDHSGLQPFMIDRGRSVTGTVRLLSEDSASSVEWGSDNMLV